MYKIILAIIMFTVATPSWSKTAKCTIKIWDYTADKKYTVEKFFNYSSNSTGDHKSFYLPGSTHICKLGFYSFEIGTNLVCYFDKLGRNFVKSDRTGIKEKAAKNNLIILFNSTNYGLKSSCELI